MRVVLEFLQRQAVWSGTECVAEGAQPKHHVQATFVAAALGQHRSQFLDRSAGHRRVRIGNLLAEGARDHLVVDQGGLGVGSHPEHDQRQPGQDLALVGPPVGQR